MLQTVLNWADKKTPPGVRKFSKTPTLTTPEGATFSKTTAHSSSFLSRTLISYVPLYHLPSTLHRKEQGVV